MLPLILMQDPNFLTDTLMIILLIIIGALIYFGTILIYDKSKSLLKKVKKTLLK